MSPDEQPETVASLARKIQRTTSAYSAEALAKQMLELALTPNPYTLITRWIRPLRLLGDPEARIIDLSVPVWALVAHWKSTNDIHLTAKEYEIEVDAVAAAIDYYRLYRNVIDARLAANGRDIPK